jgi:signal transduction histidine kinase
VLEASVPTTATPAVPRSLLILAEQTAALYRNTPMVLAGNLLMSTLLVLVLPDAIPSHVTLTWLALVYVQATARFALWLAYRRMKPPPDAARRWARWSAYGSATAGVVWGVGAIVLFVPGQIDFQLLLLFVLIGMGSSAVYALTPYLPAFFAFLLPCIIPAGFVFAIQGDSLHALLAIMIAIYVVVTLLFASNLHKVLADSLNLRFENVELVEDLKLRKDEAERANVAKSRFLAAASHDLRQPMHALALFTDSLRDELDGQPRALALVQRVQDSIDAMDGLFNALLDISKLDAGVIEKRVRDFPVQPALERLQTMFTPLALERGLRFSVVASGVSVRTDPALLDRILQNLVSNALKYTRAGGVVVGCRRRANGLSIEVWDSGAGIPPQYRRDIFQEFFQLENPERDRSKGLGLGLAIVDRIARLLGHALTLRSVPGKGSMFAVCVPYGDAANVAPELPTAEIVSSRFAGARVAVVDDEGAITDSMRELIERWGCESYCASSAAELLQLLGSRGITPDLLISDYRLRGNENGVALIQQVRAMLGSNLPAILITGDSAPERLVETHAGGFELLYKPVLPAKLRQLMNLLLAQRGTKT